MEEIQGTGEALDSGPRGARRPVRMCVRCQSITDTPVTVAEVHQNTGRLPPGSLLVRSLCPAVRQR